MVDGVAVWWCSFFFFSQNKSGTRSVKSKIIFQARFKNKSHAVYAQPFYCARAVRTPILLCLGINIYII